MNDDWDLLDAKAFLAPGVRWFMHRRTGLVVSCPCGRREKKSLDLIVFDCGCQATSVGDADYVRIICPIHTGLFHGDESQAAAGWC